MPGGDRRNEVRPSPAGRDLPRHGFDVAGYVDFRMEPGAQGRLTARGRANGQPVKLPKPYIWRGHGNDRLRAQLEGMVRHSPSRLRAHDRGAWNALLGGLKSWASDMLGYVKTIPGMIVCALSDVGHMLWNAGVSIIKGLVGGIKSAIGGIGHVIGDVGSFIKSFLPFSPAKQGPLSGRGDPYYSGLSIGKKIAQGITTSLPSLKSALAKAAKAAGKAAASSSSSSSSSSAGSSSSSSGAQPADFTQFDQWLAETGPNPADSGSWQGNPGPLGRFGLAFDPSGGPGRAGRFEGGGPFGQGGSDILAALMAEKLDEVIGTLRAQPGKFAAVSGPR